jgi:hypothetical protein
MVISVIPEGPVPPEPLALTKPEKTLKNTKITTKRFIKTSTIFLILFVLKKHRIYGEGV